MLAPLVDSSSSYEPTFLSAGADISVDEQGHVLATPGTIFSAYHSGEANSDQDEPATFFSNAKIALRGLLGRFRQPTPDEEITVDLPADLENPHTKLRFSKTKRDHIVSGTQISIDGADKQVRSSVMELSAAGKRLRQLLASHPEQISSDYARAHPGPVEEIQGPNPETQALKALLERLYTELDPAPVGPVDRYALSEGASEAQISAVNLFTVPGVSDGLIGDYKYMQVDFPSFDDQGRPTGTTTLGLQSYRRNNDSSSDTIDFSFTPLNAETGHPLLLDYTQRNKFYQAAFRAVTPHTLVKPSDLQ